MPIILMHYIELVWINY